jgi:hypothetical protein
MNQVTLDKPRPVRFTFSVLAEMERMTDHKNILNETQDFGLNDAVIMVYLGCKKADPDFSMTLEEVGDHMRGQSLEQVFKAFAEDMTTIMAGEKK